MREFCYISTMILPLAAYLKLDWNGSRVFLM